MPGKVIKGHSDIEGSCRKCHVPFKKTGQVKLCLGCHKKVASDVATRSGYHGRLDRGRACNDCHTDHKGRKASIVGLDEARFDHSLTDFVLLALHTGVKCGDCHATGRKHRDAPKSCIACHRKDDVHAGKLGIDCESCHAADGWKRGNFDHSSTRFALRSSHVRVRCRDCHKTSTFHDQPPRACVGCHRKDDVHKGRLGKKCENCHAESKWKIVRFDHERDAHFALREAHGRIECGACHKAPLHTKKMPTTCVGCHKKDDVHKGRYGADCQTCHTETRWKKVIFNHDRDTHFALRDSHRSVKCEACHSGPLHDKKPPSTCNGCHARKDVHRGTLGKRCESCHLETRWKATRFDHAKNTDYPLLGMHAKVQCKACHADGTFRKKLKTECVSCHRKDDVHSGQQGARCEGCHSESSWKTARFDHSTARFALLGSHQKVVCTECHTTMRFRDAPRACVSCHRKDDAHKGRLGATCNTCHNARDWRIWDFNHHKNTGFPLDGAHRRLACSTCHTRPGDKVHTAGGRCVDCHDRDDVHHGGFGNDCGRCHLTSTFRDMRGGAGDRKR
jgi:hypothetical protein